jgi:hypothetical protein
VADQSVRTGNNQHRFLRGYGRYAQSASSHLKDRPAQYGNGSCRQDSGRKVPPECCRKEKQCQQAKLPGYKEGSQYAVPGIS